MLSGRHPEWPHHVVVLMLDVVTVIDVVLGAMTHIGSSNLARIVVGRRGSRGPRQRDGGAGPEVVLQKGRRVIRFIFPLSHDRHTSQPRPAPSGIEIKIRAAPAP